MQAEARISRLAAAQLSARQAAEAEEEQVCAARLFCQPSLGQGEMARLLSQQIFNEELRIGLTSDCHCRRQLSNANSRSCTERLDRHSKRSPELPCATRNYNSMCSNLRCTYYLWNSSVLACAICCWQPNTGQCAHCRCLCCPGPDSSLGGTRKVCCCGRITVLECVPEGLPPLRHCESISETAARAEQQCWLTIPGQHPRLCGPSDQQASAAGEYSSAGGTAAGLPGCQQAPGR